jgi:hypothetical protein
MVRDFQKECAELVAAARAFVESGGRIEEVFNRPLFFVEREWLLTPGTKTVVSVPKLGQDFHNLLAAFRAWTAKHVPNQISSGHGDSPY